MNTLFLMSRCKIWIMADPDDHDDETRDLLTCYASPQVKKAIVHSQNKWLQHALIGESICRKTVQHVRSEED